MKISPSPNVPIIWILWICALNFVESFRLSLSQVASCASFGRGLRINRQDDKYQLKEPLCYMVDPVGMMMDPLLLESLSTVNRTASSFRTLSRGVSVWRRALVKGRVPVLEDFTSLADTTMATAEDLLWPAPKVLWDAVIQHMIQWQIPRLVHRHPELVRTILLCLLRLFDQYTEQLQTLPAFDEQGDEEVTGEDPMFIPWTEFDFDSVVDEARESQPLTTLEGLAQIAATVVAEEFQELMPTISGMHALDSLFGPTTTDSIIMESQMGIGYQNNSLWHHTGWTMIPTLQDQISRLPALRRLVQSLGRRSTARQSDGRYHRFLQRPVDDTNTASLQAQIDPRLARDTVSGLTRSNRYSEMLPSEAVGLMKTGSAAHVLRRLFYAKLVESQLLSYEISGWADVSSRPPLKKRPRYHRTPSARGGPIVICLDTSHSMTTEGKEWISKGVVLACVRAAHQQQRNCRLVAFGAKGSFMDAGDALLCPDAAAMRQLLDFLSQSFGSGTDVTGALKHAMTLFDTVSPENSPSEMSAADWLLITDGEIPNVSEEMLQTLRRLQEHSGLQVHGVLVGHSKEGKSMQALEDICTHTHNFLLDFPGQSHPKFPKLAQTRVVTSSALYMTPPKLFGKGGARSRRRSHLTVLFGRRWNDEDDYDDLDLLSSKRWIPIRANGGSGEMSVDLSIQNKETISEGKDSRNMNDYILRVQSSLEDIYLMASKAINDRSWNVTSLHCEQNSKDSCYRYRKQFQEAVNRVGENLIEREIESRLVVLGMISGEHVLFLGPPGTAKSALGRRLSMICGGTLFQRLLTRFTTPEEIFGPLSLRALENDEYKRCTEGFLPSVTVAFLDEIFKANSAILNTLLTILNERQFDNGAGRREDCPIRCVIAASNELPESDELEALYDRFLLRKEVLPVSDDGIVELLTSVSTPGVSPCDDTRGQAIDGTCDAIFADSLDGIVEKLSAAADAVQMDADVAYLLRDLRAFLRDEMSVNLSDRRLLKAARLLKVVAASHGRAHVDPIDCLLLQHVAWSLPEQREAIREWLWDHVTPGSMSQSQYHMLLNGLRQTAMTVVRRTDGDVTGDAGARGADVMALASIRTEVLQLMAVLQLQSDALSRHMELLQQSMDHLWLGPEEARISQQILIPPAHKGWQETQRLLMSACQLERTLTPSSDKKLFVPNDIRLSVMEQLWDDTEGADIVSFTDLELNMSMKEAKAKWDSDTFRRWKRERKKLGIK